MSPDQLTITLQSGNSVTLRCIGPSLWGHVYREIRNESPYFFRLIPRQHTKDAYYDFARFKQITDLIGKPIRPQIASVVEAGQVNMKSLAFLYVKYELPHARSFTDILDEKDARHRLFLVANVFKALPTWWQYNGSGFVPMPADIAVVEQWPMLLALPCQDHWPRYESLLEEKSRILYLAPEIIRGAPNTIGKRDIDLYAGCALAAQTMFIINTNAPAEFLLTASAASVLFDSDNIFSRLPNWCRNLEAFTNAYSLLCKGLHGEQAVGDHMDPLVVARAMDELAGNLDPIARALFLIANKEYEKAVSFLTEVTLEENNYELLMLAGKVCRDFLTRQLRAIEFFERAIASGFVTAEVYREQLTTIIHSFSDANSTVRSKMEIPDSELQARAERDFSLLPPDAAHHFAPEYAGYLLLKKNFSSAARVMHSRIHYSGEDGSLKHYWWEIANTLLYVKACSGLAESSTLTNEIRKHQLDELSSFIVSGLKQPLNYLNALDSFDPRHMSDAVVSRFGMEIIEIEKHIKGIREKYAM